MDAAPGRVLWSPHARRGRDRPRGAPHRHPPALGTSKARCARILREGLATLDSGVVVVEDTGTAMCSARGFKIVLRFTTRGSESDAERWTEAEAEVETSPLTLHVRPQTWRDKRDVKKGLAVDIELGGADFDARFLIEAAPVALVRSVLSSDVRQPLLAVKAYELSTGESKVILAKRGWNEEQRHIRNSWMPLPWSPAG